VRAVFIALLLPAACPAPPEPPSARAPAPPAEERPTLPPLSPFAPTETDSLDDFLPPTLGGAPVQERRVAADRVQGTYAVADRTIEVILERPGDLAAARAPFELLGRDLVARRDGQELRGLRVQGNPAQLARQLTPPYQGTATVVGANTWLVTVRMTPTTDLDELEAVLAGVPIGALTRLAGDRHRRGE
jgi:hypothetical protein